MAKGVARSDGAAEVSIGEAGLLYLIGANPSLLGKKLREIPNRLISAPGGHLVRIGGIYRKP